MLFEGLKLMLAGMFVVYVFLTLLLVLIKVSAYFFDTASESSAMPATQNPSSGASPDYEDSGRVVAVVSAAVSVYKSKRV